MRGRHCPSDVVVRWHKLAANLHRSRAAYVGREVVILRRLEYATDRLTPIPVQLSSEMLEPGIFGNLRPILLWPERLSEHLDHKQIETILAHELMHVRRHDNLTATLHMLVEAVFWFHPLVWWIERRHDWDRSDCDAAGVRRGQAMREPALLLFEPPAPRAPQLIPTTTGTQPILGMSNVANAGRASATSQVSPRLPTGANADAVPGQPSHLEFEVGYDQRVSRRQLNAVIKPYPGGDGYTVQNMPLKDMIAIIYRVPRQQVIGGPDWISSERFDHNNPRKRAAS
jgi:hypothetical protein